MPGNRPGARWTLGMAICAIALIAPTAPSWAQTARPMSCDDLGKASVPTTAIHLPTGGVRITGATQMAASGTGATAVGAFCRVRAEILPVDPAAPPIRMELNLPEAWNGKALMYGGGGFNGSPLSTGGTIRLQPTTTAIPLGRGYATFSSDSGHQGTSNEAAFAMNDEALRNYAYEALKKTHDAASFLIQARYGRPLEKLYFHGSSNGGKEAFAMISRYPADIDGAIIFWPAAAFVPLTLQHVRIDRAMLAPDGFPGIAKRQALYAAGLAACDTLDGVADKLVSNARRCQVVFDPATARIDGKSLRCANGGKGGGGEGGDACLSDPQIHTLRTMETPIDLRASLGAAQPSYPGFNVWGTDLGTKTSDDMSRNVTIQGFGTVDPAIPATANMPFIHIFADQFVKYFVMRDANADPRQFNPEAPGRYRARVAELARLLDTDKPDLSAFQKRGGKILMVHGMADQIIPTQASEAYYGQVVRRMGQPAVDRFFRFYELPGTQHSGWGIAFTPTWDALGALDAWETQGTAPVAPEITDIYADPGRTLPLCPYPTWPKYKGTGDARKAASFACVR